MADQRHHTYTVRVSAEFVHAWREWHRVKDADCDWMRVVPHDDGTAEVLLSNGDDPPRDFVDG